jgi:hypothetical protein
VVLTGEHFAEGVKVLFGDAAVAVTRDGATTLHVTTPARAEKGSVDVRVENPDGQAAVLPLAFRYDPPPFISGVEPRVASVKGGAVLTILGADFAEGTTVLIDGQPVPSAFAHAGRLEAVVQAHAAGEVDVVVKGPDGQRATASPGLRFADPPAIEGLTPARDITVGGIEVRIRGRAFEPGCAVLFADVPLAQVGFVSDTELRVVTPGHDAVETVAVAVVNPTGLSHRVRDAFRYDKAPPRVFSVEPAYGPNVGGTRLSIRGRDFDESCAVFVCGLHAPVTWIHVGEIVAVTPAVARDGLVDVRVVNTDDQAATVPDAFRYDAPLPPPSLDKVSPATGLTTGGLKVAVLGDDFADGVRVRFGGVEAEVRFLTRRELEAVTPAYAVAGEVTVEVVNPDGVVATLEKAFAYEARPAPVITGVTPPSGPTTGGTRVVIEGANFNKECLVYVGREYPKDLVVKSATEIQIVTAPRKAAGVVDVEVAAPGLPKAVQKNGFRYDAQPAPVITSVSPNAGRVDGGTEMTVAGKNFLKDTVVLVDGKPVRTVKLINATTLEFKTPPGEGGRMVDVAVRNPDGKDAVQKRAFLYDPRYR